MTYEIILKIVPQDGFYRATAHLDLAGSSESQPLISTEPQLSRSQNRAISYALTELATLFDRFCMSTPNYCALAPGHEGPCRSTR